MKANKKFQEETLTKKLYVCGIDEAGRGCLSGPVSIGAVLLPEKTNKSFLKDSKELTQQEREEAYEWIIAHTFYSVVFIDVHTIEKKNIYHATRLGMQKAFLQLLSVIPFSRKNISHLITDAVPLKLEKQFVHESMIIKNPPRAENAYPAVAAASVIAKVTRDRFMEKLAKSFPGFAFEQHKGYGTSVHTDAIKKYGKTIVHRPSFLIKFFKENSGDKQKSIF